MASGKRQLPGLGQRKAFARGCLTAALSRGSLKVDIRSGLAQRWARYAALVFFALLAAASLFMALEGRSHCGCFGRVEINPWWTFGLDVLCFVGLVVFGRRTGRMACDSASTLNAKQRVFSGKMMAWAALCLAVVGLGLQFVASSLIASLNPVVPELPVVDLGIVPAYSTRLHEVRFRNTASRPVEILQVCVTCRCSKELLPPNGVLFPGATFAVPVRVHAGPAFDLQHSLLIRFVYK
ncbi:MAG: DUF1573 domain-containing protein [Gemmatales bacterium]|nr:DUF1573 domain-containing protein [Gemmatales bacterium]MDW8387362.1 hypothetical protein [Gemmatales bacterium]